MFISVDAVVLKSLDEAKCKRDELPERRRFLISVVELNLMLSSDIVL